MDMTWKISLKQNNKTKFGQNKEDLIWNQSFRLVYRPVSLVF